MLRRNDPANFEALISELVLREPVGTSEIMNAQLNHLVQVGQQSNITIRVVPLRTGWHPGWLGPFVLYEFADAPDVVHFEHYSSGAFIPDEYDVGQYRKAVARIRNLALSQAESLDYIAKLREQREDDR